MNKYGGAQKENSSLDSPVPLPRSRQQQQLRLPATAEPQASGVYEPVSVNYVNAYVVREPPKPPVSGELNRPIPAPRQRAKVMLLECKQEKEKGGSDTVQGDVQRDQRYQNIVIVRPDHAPLHTASSVDPSKGTFLTNNFAVATTPGVPMKYASNILPQPGKVNNTLHEQVVASGAESAGLSIDNVDSGGIVGEETKGTGSQSGLKYKTSSPADLFKTISTTTRLLTESIGERVAHKTKKAANNVRTTGSSLVTWGVRNVGRGAKATAEDEIETTVEPKQNRVNNLKQSPTMDTTRPQTLPSPHLMQKIKFDSPLPLNKAVVPGAVSSKSDAGEDGQTTYDIPKRASNPSNLCSQNSPSVSSTAPSTAPSSHCGSACASSSSMASSGAGTGLFQRNALVSQSLYSRVLPKRGRRYGSPGERTGGAMASLDQPSFAGALVRSSKNKSESNLYESTFYIARPPPTMDSKHLYGKLNIIARPSISTNSSSSCSVASLNDDDGGSEEDNNLPELLLTGVQLRDKAREAAESPNLSNRATYRTSSDEPPTHRWIFSRRLSAAGEPVLTGLPTSVSNERQHRSDSWNFYDIAGAVATAGVAGGVSRKGDEEEEKFEEEEQKMDDDDDLSHISTPEPVYANDDLQPGTAPIYDQLSDMETVTMLKPIPAELARLHSRHDYDEVSIADIIDEFDPLTTAAGAATLEAIIENSVHDGAPRCRGGNLALIENLLGAESYSRRWMHPRDPSVVKICGINPKSITGRAQAYDAPADDYGGRPEETHRACPKPPQRSDSLLATATAGGERTGEAPVRAVPAKPKRNKARSQRADTADARAPDSVIIHQNLNLPSGSVENLVELDGYLIEPHLATLDERVMLPGAEAVDLSYPKTPQTSWYLFPDGAGDSNVPAIQTIATGDSEDAEDYPLPSYFEAIGGTDPLFERPLAVTAPPAKPTSVATKLLNALKRRPSLNRGNGASSSESGTVCTALEMVPKPQLTERLISHKGHVLKFPSGKIGDVLNELSPRSVVLRERIFQTYLDPQQTLPKEAIQLRYIMSLQCILQHKFAGEGRLDLHCFEIVLGVPKGGGGGIGASGGGGYSAAAVAMSTNPDLLITSSTNGNVKLARQSFMFGTHKRSDRNIWMAKVLQSVTDVFGGEGDLIREFLRAGWCYVKKSVSADWAGAWLLLAKRKLYLYSFAESRLEVLDLRKARCIGVIENEPSSIANLHVEVGPTVFIDCPPYATLYFIMGSPRETQIWHKVIRQVAHKNGPTLHSQQLTRGDVPVLIDKCINFIYAHGSMSEGIYRKSGSMLVVGRILQLFAEDAYDVQLTRNEYNEYEVAGALKKFIRELPGSFFGSYAASFVAIGSLSDVDLQLKVDSYRQLLERLPRIEYCTLKKLLGHLAFIASLEKHNRMGVPNLAMIWGSTLLVNASQNTVQDPGSYHQQDADVVADLIRLYRRLFPVGADELRKDQLMLAVLQKYHAAAENLSDAVKHSGDLKVWITIDCDSPPEESMGAGVNSVASEDNLQINVTITPLKTASDVCKELAAKTKYPWYKLTLYEVIANGALIRPIHYCEKVLEIVVRWTYWDEVDRKHNYLTLKPTTTLNDVYRTIQKAPVLTPTMELKFADRKTKTLRSFQLQLIGRGLVVLKKIEKKDKGFEELLKIDLARATAYIGCEPKRNRTNLRWAITLVENDFKKRTRDAPYIGHIFGGLDFASQILWYSSILYSQYKDDILPSGDLLF